MYAIVDPACIRGRHYPLFKKIFDLTFVLAQRLSTIAHGDVKYFETIDQAMNYGRAYDLVIMQSVGNFIIEYRLLVELDRFCESNRDFFLLAFPSPLQIDRDDILADFDTRMLVVNVDRWEQIGYPGLDEESSLTESMPKYDSENATICDSAPPLPAEDAHEATAMTSAGRGRKFLDSVLFRDLIVHTFPEPLRDYSVYIWPEFESAKLYEALLNRDVSLVSNSDQKNWIQSSIPRPAIWIYNSEPYRFNIPLQYCDVYFGPAAGFKYLDILAYNPNVEFFFYDQNQDSLEWIKSLKCNWDGNDFLGYVSRQPKSLSKKFKYVNSSLEKNIEIMFSEFGGEDGFKRLWKLFKTANATFSHCDLFNADDVDTLTSQAKATRPFFYYSNIFSTNFTLTVFSREQAEEKYSCFKSIVKKRFPNAIMHGADVAGRWH